MARRYNDEPVTQEVAQAWFEGTDPDLRYRILKDLVANANRNSEEAESKVDKLKQWRYLNAALVLSICLAILGGWSALADKAKSAAETVKKDLEKHEAVEAAAILEVRQDIKALYQVILTRKRNERLERPLPDAGSDGGGDE